MTVDEHSTVITRTANAVDRDAIASLIATAFAPIPPARWLLGDGRVPAWWVGYMAIFADHGLAVGRVEVAETPTTGGLVGVMIWWPNPGPEPANYSRRLAAVVDAKRLPRFERFDALTHARHPETQHLYLAFAAVHPDHQGRGIGTVLLRRRHSDLDASRIPAYLVAASPEARRLYLRHGYADHGGRLGLPDGPALYPMWRHPTDNH